MQKIKVLFVCMGNICRSPTAQGVFEKLVEDEGLAGQVDIDSAGTHAYHVGEPPDQRATAAAASRGIDLTPQRARRVCQEDFERFDYIVAMDHANMSELETICPAHLRERVHLLLDFSGADQPREVPDPYYGGAQGFEHVLDLVEQGARGLLAEIRRRLQPA